MTGQEVLDKFYEQFPIRDPKKIKPLHEYIDDAILAAKEKAVRDYRNYQTQYWKESMTEFLKKKVP